MKMFRVICRLYKSADYAEERYYCLKRHSLDFGFTVFVHFQGQIHGLDIYLNGNVHSVKFWQSVVASVSLNGGALLVLENVDKVTDLSTGKAM